ncbi:hypothetical protein I302_100076 [Kwoniella bestiolae CBS 10118]|uniref:Uncharacterized protein n=1 Tax=Kwoniella bestiolae CBS 10118 TaxID=1296100 RepID=A0A1B9G414_9TREE|nr:hypothetical protein I302_03448 [Kwoniella bestiolae CBS 10118]OCF25775.1 hypothetical protein I302_03448 [Kwoniella bestiolae CBS 10118]
MTRFRSFFKRLVHPHSPSSHDTHPSGYPTPVHLLPKWQDPYLNPKVFQRLLPVHHLIIDALFSLDPALVVLLSQPLYDKYIPILYKDITMRPYAFSGLFRTYSRGCEDDNNTIRAYKHTEILHLMDRSNAFQIGTITCGDQPAFVPHSDLFENVRKIDMAWDVYLAQGEENLYYMFVDFASKLNEQLRDGTVEELVVEIKDGSRMVNHRKLIQEYEEGIKPKHITFIITQDFIPNNDNKRHNGSLCVNMVPVTLKHAQLVRFVVPRSLGLYDHTCFVYQLRVLYEDWKKLKDQNQLVDRKVKLEYYVIGAESVKEGAYRDLRSNNRWDVLSWMEERVEFRELDQCEKELRWSRILEHVRTDR